MRILLGKRVAIRIDILRLRVDNWNWRLRACYFESSFPPLILELKCGVWLYRFRGRARRMCDLTLAAVVLHVAECFAWFAAPRPLRIHELHCLPADVDEAVDCLILHLENVF